MKFSIASLARPYSMETKKCQLCNMEKTLIACQDQTKALNRRGEIMTRCRHRDKYILTNWVTQHHPLDEDTQATTTLPMTAMEHHLPQDEADVPPPTAEEHHLLQHPEHLPAEEDDEGTQTGIQNEGGPMTRARTRARNKPIL